MVIQDTDVKEYLYLRHTSTEDWEYEVEMRRSIKIKLPEHEKSVIEKCKKEAYKTLHPLHILIRIGKLGN